MHSLFRAYYAPDDAEFTRLWNEGLFVFDANVLLDLYFYAETIRETMFRVLGKLAPRIWIPYHAGLEYQRNRLQRIKQVTTTLTELQSQIRSTQDAIAKEIERLRLTERELGLPDLDNRILAVKRSHEALIEAVEIARTKLPVLSLSDPIRNRLSALFDSRTGPPPQDSEQIARWVHDAAFRAEHRIPPGYLDSGKDTTRFRDQGIDYERRHGDLILWQQVLDHIRTKELRAVVFVTGDLKEDWWLRAEGQILGPRPELVQEALGAIEDGLFWMYPTHAFLERAKALLETPVADAAIERVFEVSNQRATTDVAASVAGARFNFERLLEEAVIRWAPRRHGDEPARSDGQADFVIATAAGRHRYDILPSETSDSQTLCAVASDKLLSAYTRASVDDRTTFNLVIVCPAFGEGDEFIEKLLPAGRWLQEFLGKYPRASVTIGDLRLREFEPAFTARAGQLQSRHSASGPV